MPTSWRSPLRSTPRPDDPLAVDADLAAVDRLERVDAAQQRRLAAARRPDQAHDLVLVDVEVDALSTSFVAEPLVDVAELEEGRHCARIVPSGRA